MAMFQSYMMTVSKFVMILLSVVIMVRCIRSMLREQYEPEIWAYLRVGRETLPVNHWENLIGRSRSADIRLNLEKISLVHAVLSRNDRGNWVIYDIFSKGGVWVNGLKVSPRGILLQDGDVINLAGHTARFLAIPQEKRVKLESKRHAAGRVSPTLTLLQLMVFQLFLLMQHAFTAKSEDLPAIALGFAALIVLEWSTYNAMRVIGRMGFEVETLAFYLTTLGMSVAASSTPGDMYKQILLTFAAVVLFVIGGWWLRNLHRTSALRIPIAGAALFLLSDWMMRLFTPDPAVIRLGATVLKMVAVTEPLYGVAVVLEGIFEGVGDMLYAMVCNIIGMWGLRVLCTVVAVRAFGGGLTAAWGCMIAHNILLFVLFVLRYRSDRWNPLGRKASGIREQATGNREQE